MKIFELDRKSKQSMNESRVKMVKKICESMINYMEAEGDIEWEPQPEFRGKAGVTTTSGVGEKAARDAQQKQMAEKVNASWHNMLTKVKGMDKAARQQALPHLQALAKKAQQMGVQLNPDPGKILGQRID